VRPPIVLLAAKPRDFLRKEIKSDELLRALVVIGPLVVGYFFLREPALLSLGLIAISLLIPALKLRLAPGAVALHFLAILITFATLFLAGPIKPLFVERPGGDHPHSGRKLNWNTAPRGSFAPAQSRPPCASMIELQIDRPMPIPPGLVV